MTAADSTAPDTPSIAGAPPEDEELSRMSFGDHLDELRKRLVRAMGAVILAIVCLMPFKMEVQEIILGPYRSLWRATYTDYVDGLEAKAADGTLTKLGAGYLEFNREYKDILLAGGDGFTEYDAIRSLGGFQMPYELVAISGLQDFWTFMAASLVFALCLASPVVLWQAWAFIAAGLYKKERTVVYRHLPLAIALLVAGILFGYFLVVPYGLYFLVKLMNPGQVT
ncbi:MAG: twin-arginine translocase subunit TatC, partial [Myxococcota bacterium]